MYFGDMKKKKSHNCLQMKPFFFFNSRSQARCFLITELELGHGRCEICIAVCDIQSQASKWSSREATTHFVNFRSRAFNKFLRGFIHVP